MDSINLRNITTLPKRKFHRLIFTATNASHDSIQRLWTLVQLIRTYDIGHTYRTPKISSSLSAKLPPSAEPSARQSAENKTLENLGT